MLHASFGLRMLKTFRSARRSGGARYSEVHITITDDALFCGVGVALW